MKILIADDDDITSDIMESILTASGHQTRIAGDGLDALELFNSFSPDVVITDIQMPRMTGLELLAEIRKRNSEAIVIVATAYGSEEYALKALRTKANNYLKKPIEPAQLLAMIDHYTAATEARYKERAVSRFITDSRLTMSFGNCIELVYDIVDYLINQAGRHLPESDVPMLRLALVELITNAIEHGNLGITYDMKTRAMDHAGGYNEFLAMRKADPAVADRKVSVQARIDKDSCEWTISDEGDGFDWRGMPAELTPESLFSSHGRGIMLSRLNFDKLEFIGRGNTVRVVKNLK